MVILAERKLMTYVYAVGKQPYGNKWYKAVEHGRAKLWNCGTGIATFLLIYVILNMLYLIPRLQYYNK